MAIKVAAKVAVKLAVKVAVKEKVCVSLMGLRILSGSLVVATKPTKATLLALQLDS